MISKKAAFPIFKTLVILSITSILLILFTVIVLNGSSISIDERKISSQIIIKNSLNCFSNQYGFIEETKFTQEQFNSCIQDSSSSFVKIELYSSFQKEIFAYEKENEFNQKLQLCSIPNSNLYCFQEFYPVIVKDKSGEEITSMLKITTISQ